MGSNKNEYRIIIVSATSGHKIEEWTDELILRAHNDSDLDRINLLENAICVEDYISGALDILVEKEGWKLDIPLGGFGLKEFLRELPYNEILKTCKIALRLSLEELESQLKSNFPDGGYGILTIHPVLFTHRTREFAEPYSASVLRELTAELDLDLELIVSLHDDIYDIYRRLMDPGDLFNPIVTREPDPEKGYKREPKRDFYELLLILSWRDRELASAHSLAVEADINHLLYHRKGRLDSLAKYIFESKPIIYFSHPISQPRRDLLEKPEEGKCKIPDPDRGRRLQSNIQNFADRLAGIVPIIEPTAIDEYRINIDGFDQVSDVDLRHMILPPVTKRWPRGGGTRADKGGADEFTLESNGQLEVKEKIFKDFNFDDCTVEEIKSLKPICYVLQNEIRRQIGVRDYALSEQADAVIAYRPFSLPDSPAPTGGVDKEMKAIQRIMEVREVTHHPELVVIHPSIDETRRRKNAFLTFWEQKVQDWINNPNGKEAKKLKQKILDELKGWDWHPENFNMENGLQEAKNKIYERISEILKKSKTDFKPYSDTSSMAVDGLGLANQAKSDFITNLVEKTDVVFPQLLVEMEENTNLEKMVVFIDAVELDVSLSKKLSKLIKQEEKKETL